MRKLFIITVLLTFFPCFAEAPTLKNVVGTWQNANYLFMLTNSYKATVIIYATKYQTFVFSGIYTVENDAKLRINISEIKTCNPGEEKSRKGFTKTASSRFVFAADIAANSRGKQMNIKPKEIIIDGNNSEGYFDSSISLQKK
jgi:hypothetical protein